MTIRGWLLFEVQTSRLLFFSALPQCGDYSRAATIQSTDVAATIYFSCTAMRRLLEGGYYSKCRRRGYYLLQLYRNVVTIQGRLLFEVQTSRLLFISALPQWVTIQGRLLFEVQTSRLLFISALLQCGDYSRVATIRGWLLFEVQTSRLLFFSALPQCGDYSRAATIQSTDVAATIYFSSTAMRRLFEGRYYSKCRRRGYYLFQLYRNVVTIQGRLLFKVQTSRLLFISALLQNAATTRGRLLFEVQTSRLLFISALPQWVTIQGRLLFEVQMSRLLFISALPQCGYYSRAATIRGADITATIYFSSTTMGRQFEGSYYSKCRRRGYYLFQLYLNG